LVTLAATRASGGQRDESGRGKEEEAMMTAAAMLSRESRRWGYRDDDDGKEEVVEVDDNNETVLASGGGSRQKGGFEKSLRRTARPTAPTGRMGAVTAKSTKQYPKSLCDIENKSCFGGTCAHHPQIREK
jgi:hypothetical protein